MQEIARRVKNTLYFTKVQTYDNFIQRTLQKLKHIIISI